MSDDIDVTIEKPLHADRCTTWRDGPIKKLGVYEILFGDCETSITGVVFQDEVGVKSFVVPNWIRPGVLDECADVVKWRRLHRPDGHPDHLELRVTNLRANDEVVVTVANKDIRTFSMLHEMRGQDGVLSPIRIERAERACPRCGTEMAKISETDWAYQCLCLLKGEEEDD